MSAASGAPPPRGRFVDIGGRRLRIVCEGPKGPKPTVILESGAFGFAADWAVVQARLAAEGVRSCAYDRAGMGYSDPGPAPRDGIAVAEDLEKLLAAADEPGPYVLVGHSMAGLRIRLFTDRNPGKVLGLVLVDAASPELTNSPHVQHFLGPFTQISHVTSWAASIGLLKPIAFMGDSIGLPPEAAAEKHWAFASARHNQTSADEVSHWIRTSEQAEASGPLNPDLPVAVIVAGHGAGGPWKDAYAEPARRSKHGYFMNVPDAGHANLLGFKHAAQIVKGVDFVLTAASASAGPAQAAGAG